MMGRAIGTGLGLLFGAALLVGCAGRHSTEPIPVGVLAPRTGPDKLHGESAWQGAVLAQAEVDGNNLIHSRHVLLQQGDTGAGPEAAQAVAGRLVQVDNVVALLADFGVHHGDRLGSVAEEGRVPLILPAELPGPSNKNVFHTAAAPVERGRALARFALEQKARRALVLTFVEAGKTEPSGVNAALTEGFKEAFKTEGLTVHAYTKRAELPELVRSNKSADVLVLVGPSADLGALPTGKSDSKRLHIWAGPEGGVQTLHDHAELPPVYLATSFWFDPAAAPVKDFMARYHDKFKQTPDVFATVGYDDARLLFEALRRAERLEPEKIQTALAGLSDFPSLTGPVSIREGWARRTVFVLRVVQGKAALVKAYPSEP
ncbi:MAG TPA: ABC transporter substrate-binding protein [Gemmataceae bacterium]|nr:ABC transporter substrate-binding protein [Gemmataceae bacterium]